MGARPIVAFAVDRNEVKPSPFGGEEDVLVCVGIVLLSCLVHFAFLFQSLSVLFFIILHALASSVLRDLVKAFLVSLCMFFIFFYDFKHLYKLVVVKTFQWLDPISS